MGCYTEQRLGAVVINLLLIVFLALSLANELKPLNSGTEPAQACACVPTEADQVRCFGSKFDDDQRHARTFPVTRLAPPFDCVPVVAGHCQHGRPMESLGNRLQFYTLNVVLLI
jgi:hypothetical protein